MSVGLRKRRKEMMGYIAPEELRSAPQRVRFIDFDELHADPAIRWFKSLHEVSSLRLDRGPETAPDGPHTHKAIHKASFVVNGYSLEMILKEPLPKKSPYGPIPLPLEVVQARIGNTRVTVPSNLRQALSALMPLLDLKVEFTRNGLTPLLDLIKERTKRKWDEILVDDQSFKFGGHLVREAVISYRLAGQLNLTRSEDTGCIIEVEAWIHGSPRGESLKLEGRSLNRLEIFDLIADFVADRWR
jgi:hypothetical protein